MEFVCLPTKNLEALKNSFSTECSAFRIAELASFEISWHFTDLGAAGHQRNGRREASHRKIAN